MKPARRCRHRSTRRAWWHNGTWITWSHIARGQAGVGLLWDDHAARRCNDCGHWLSLGPANDADVSAEIEAARILAGVHAPPEAVVSWQVLGGVMGHDEQSDPPQGALAWLWHAGWLARHVCLEDMRDMEVTTGGDL